MPIIGNPIYQSAFVVDQFSGNGSTVAFTMSVAPAGVTNVLVSVSGVLQDPSTYGVVGNTITFSAAPPSGTGNISCRYLGIPVTGVTTTAYRTVTEFTATASQTTFTPPSYTVGFINVYLNGVLLGSADYTATNGTTVVLTTGASSGNLVTVESFLVSSVLNAIPNTAGSVSSSNIVSGVSLTAPNLGTPASGVMTNVTGLPAAQLTGSRTIPKGTMPAGSVLQVVSVANKVGTSTTGNTYIASTLAASITPTSSSSKILVFGHFYVRTSASAVSAVSTLYRNSTDLTSGTLGLSYVYAASSNLEITAPFSYLDSPATTSSTTYTIYFKRSDAAGTAALGNAQSDSVITLMEVAA